MVFIFSVAKWATDFGDELWNLGMTVTKFTDIKYVSMFSGTICLFHTDFVFEKVRYLYKEKREVDSL